MKQIRNTLTWSLILLPVLLYGQVAGPAEGLVGHWSFDRIGEGGVVEDHTAYGVHGRISGTRSSAGIKGNALQFDGVDDWVTITVPGGGAPGHIASLGEGTLSIWFRLDRVPDGKGIQPIFYYGAWSACSNMFDAANQGMIIEVGHHPVHWLSKRLYFTIFANGCTLPSFCFDSWIDLEPSRWYHFAAVVGEDFNTGYLDGEPMSLINYNFGNSSDSEFFEDGKQGEVIWLGKGFWDAETYFLEGAVDDLRIYDRPLTAEEVAALHRETLATSVFSGEQNGSVLYPNPASDHVVVETGSGPPGEVPFRLTDLAGRVLAEGETTGRIETSGLAPGSYRLWLGKKEPPEVLPLLIVR